MDGYLRKPIDLHALERSLLPLLGAAQDCAAKVPS
jgi:hypothetical protein